MSRLPGLGDPSISSGEPVWGEKHSVVSLESDGICRWIDLARLADVEPLHDERAPTVAAATSAFGALTS